MMNRSNTTSSNDNEKSNDTPVKCLINTPLSNSDTLMGTEYI